MFKKSSFLVFTVLLFVFACRPVPLPMKQAKVDSSDIPAENGKSESTTDEQFEDKVQEQQILVEQPKLTPAQHLEKGISLLKVGRIAKAQIEFEAVLEQQANNKSAQKMLRQIKLTPQKYFTQPMKPKPYTVQTGDTFSTLATKFLNDPLEFHVLAKYNRIIDPTRLKVDQIIMIPVIPEVIKPKPVAETKPKPPENVEYTLAKNYYSQGRYQSAIAILEPRIQKHSDDYRSRDLLVLTYTKYAYNLVDKANLLEAQTILQKAVGIQPDNKQLKNQLSTIEKQRKADLYYSDGIKALKSGNKNEALAAFRNSLQLQPTHKHAQTQVSKLQGEVVSGLHKEAMTLYSNQELVQAIGTWDKVLELDPNHELAKLYRQRAVDLRDRLKKF